MNWELGAQEGHSILLETVRLRLRRFVQADLDRLVDLDSDPQVMRYISYGVPTPRERYVFEILPRWLAFQDAAPRLGYRAAELKDSGEFIGWFHLRPDRFDAGEQELGYRLRRSAWGQGHATEGGFVYPEDILAGRSEAERAAVKYSVTESCWRARTA